MLISYVVVDKIIGYSDLETQLKIKITSKWFNEMVIIREIWDIKFGSKITNIILSDHPFLKKLDCQKSEVTDASIQNLLNLEELDCKNTKLEI